MCTWGSISFRATCSPVKMAIELEMKLLEAHKRLTVERFSQAHQAGQDG